MFDVQQVIPPFLGKRELCYGWLQVGWISWISWLLRHPGDGWRFHDSEHVRTAVAMMGACVFVMTSLISSMPLKMSISSFSPWASNTTDRSNGQRVKAWEHRWGEHTEHTEHTKPNHRTFFKKKHEMNMAEGEIPLCKWFFSRCPWPDHHPPAPSHSDRSWSPILRPVDDESVTDPVGLRGVVAADL